MKRLLKLLIFLSLAVGAGYYLYNNNEEFRELVTEILKEEQKKIEPETDSLVSVYPKGTKTDIPGERKKKIPKILKPDAFYSLDEYARNTPADYEKDIRTLSQYLTQPAQTEIEKARVLFTWVATHIRYDDIAFNSANYADYSAESVLKNKSAVCEGFSNILEALCISIGLEAKKITGYAKGYGYIQGSPFSETNHAWNAIKINNKWRLFDATWAGCYAKNVKGKMVSTIRFEPYWFDVNPKAFIFTHLPEQPNWQLTDSSLTLVKFVKLPYLNESFFKMGFNPDHIYNAASSETVTDFVDTYPANFPLDFSKNPISHTVKKNSDLSFEIQSDYADDIAIIDDHVWHHFTKDKNTFTLTHKPTGNELKICVKINWFDKNYTTIAIYRVTVDDKRKMADNSN